MYKYKVNFTVEAMIPVDIQNKYLRPKEKNQEKRWDSYKTYIDDVWEKDKAPKNFGELELIEQGLEYTSEDYEIGKGFTKASVTVIYRYEVTKVISYTRQIDKRDLLTDDIPYYIKQDFEDYLENHADWGDLKKDGYCYVNTIEEV